MNDLFFVPKGLDYSKLPFYDEGEKMQEEMIYIGNKTNKSFHFQGCMYAPRNLQKRIEFTSIEEARKNGFKPCSTCNPT